jgi:hypothetical protein
VALLAGTVYDPTTAATKSTASAIAMTALDTTNLRLTFTATQTAVLVRMRCCVATVTTTTLPAIMLGVLDGSTVKGRQSPINGRNAGAVANEHQTYEASFVVTGLTAGQSYTWDAAYGVETVDANAKIKYGGPDNATTNDAWGGFVFEIWETRNLLVGINYDPTTAVAKSTASLLAMTALDTTNLRATFTVPASGKVWVRMRGTVEGGTTCPALHFSILDGATIRGRTVPIGGLDSATAVATGHYTFESGFPVTGLTPGASLTWDAAYGVDVVVASTNLQYGGPDNTTANDAWGGFVYEVWAA